MTNKKAEEIIERLKEKNKTVSIKFTGDEENKVYGFSLLMESQNRIDCIGKGYHGITKETIELLEEAEIKFEILNKEGGKK